MNLPLLFHTINSEGGGIVMLNRTEKALDYRARRAAEKVGLIVRKSRQQESVENYGGYMLVDIHTNGTVAGFRFDMTADEVIEYCNR
jgi:hypothetical protein